jgi:Zn finger protein HypA/HybF involved in hydrogenase expression
MDGNRLMAKKLESFLIEIVGCRCMRCNHTWVPRGKKPRFCPKCKSPYWDKQKKNLL